MLMEDFLGDGMELDGTSLGAYVHTSYAALEEALRFAGVDQNSCVVDIGCGDGRAALVAAARFGCHAVGGIDCDAPLIEKFAEKAKCLVDNIVTDTVASAAESTTSKGSSSNLTLAAGQETRFVCVAADALAWGRQTKLFYNDEELKAVVPPRGVVFVNEADDAHGKDILLPTPSHIYLYILQHRLKFLVPLLKRIRRDVPGVVIVSAFEFEVRPAEGDSTAVHPQQGVSEAGGPTESDYLDVPVESSFVESKGRLTFRVYK
jgi:SAM-dependent methyltransferase